MNTLPILLDTDIGSDIDDAVALAYLLRQSRCELLGITTVSGEAHKRASIADGLLRVAGRSDVPVHVGAERPLLVEQHQPQAAHFGAMAAKWEHSDFDKANTAVEFLRRTIRSRPGEITLLTIGPLTNIALLFALDPEIPSLLKELVLMGGQFFGRGYRMGSLTEWNIICDPHAAAVMFAAPDLNVTAIGLDVTMRCQLPADECRARFAAAGGALTPVAVMAEEWFKHSPMITFHDPLAAAFLFERSLCETVSGKIVVELQGAHTMGQAVIETETQHNHSAAERVDVDRFFKHYFDVVAG